jgi:recombination protein RecA
MQKGKEIIGASTKAKVVKNKMAPPFRFAEFDILYGEGISKYGELVDLGVEKNTIQKAGTWYSYGDERIGQGRDAAIEFLKTNQDIAQKVEKSIREALFGKAQKSEDKQDRTSKKE